MPDEEKQSLVESVEMERETEEKSCLRDAIY